jgi:superfamily II DNA or RNA helicase
VNESDPEVWTCKARKGTLQQYVGRLHRLRDAKRVVRVYDYVDSNVLMLARMYARRLKGYNLIGYTIRDAGNERSFSQQVEKSIYQRALRNRET